MSRRKTASAVAPLVIECMVPARAKAPSRRRLQRWLQVAVGTRGRGHELALQLVSSTRMQSLNFKFRGKNKPTNVLSFSPTPVPGVSPRPLGDIVICPTVLRREAREQGKSQDAHWAHLVIHGALHLLGYDHERDQDAKRMERRETVLMRKLGFTDPYRRVYD
jgi:probable rRNA maturation factor